GRRNRATAYGGPRFVRTGGSPGGKGGSGCLATAQTRNEIVATRRPRPAEGPSLPDNSDPEGDSHVAPLRIGLAPPPTPGRHPPAARTAGRPLPAEHLHRDHPPRRRPRLAPGGGRRRQ